MQRDFIEEGGFGSILGNDVRPLAAIVPTVRRLIDGFRAAGLSVIHTREGHRPDLSDCPPAKRARGGGALTIGDSGRSAEHTSELQSLMRIPYACFCWKKTNTT